MIGIRADANDQIAMGHIMRCMSIARQLKQRDFEIVFIISEDDAGSLIAENGFRFICLNNQHDQKEQEIEYLKELIAQEKIDRLLIDSYDVTSGYMQKLQKVCKIIYIDDLNQFRYPADLIINYTYGASLALYNKKGYKNEKFLLGSDFIPLRPEFSQSRIKIQKDISSVFISTGGTDEYNVIIHVLKKMQTSCFKNIRKNVVTGKFYKYTEELNTMCQMDNTICNYHDVQDIFNVMQKSDLAITAGGTTFSELCACGIPSVCFLIADNQYAGIKAYADAGMLLYAGDIRINQEIVLNKVIQMAEFLYEDVIYRECMAEKAKKVIDGKGAARIADAIEKLCS